MADQSTELGDTEIQALNRLPGEPYEDFIKLVFDFLLNPKDSDNLLNELGAFCESNGASYGGVKNLVKSLLFFLRNAAKRCLTPELILDQLKKHGLEENKAIILQELWKGRFGAISRCIVGQVFTINQLVDMEWKFGVTAATSDMNQVGHSFLQLKLVIKKGDEIENVYLELTLPQFYSFMHEMEKAKAGLELLS